MSREKLLDTETKNFSDPYVLNDVNYITPKKHIVHLQKMTKCDSIFLAIAIIFFATQIAIGAIFRGDDKCDNAVTQTSWLIINGTAGILFCILAIIDCFSSSISSIRLIITALVLAMFLISWTLYGTSMLYFDCRNTVPWYIQLYTLSCIIIVYLLIFCAPLCRK